MARQAAGTRAVSGGGPAETASTRDRILEAAREAILEGGFSGLSTRQIAQQAGVPLSQLHYHLGTKQQLILALLERENQRLLARQTSMYASDAPLWQQWDQACDYLELDLASGYVGLLQELIAAGWSDPDLAAEVRSSLAGWHRLLTDVAARAAGEVGLGPFTPAEVAALVGNVFIGTEALILLGFSEDDLPARSALRKVGRLLQALEEA